MFKSLFAEFIAFLAYKQDERYHELEQRIQQLEQERNQPVLIEAPKQNDKYDKRLEDLERKVFWERHI